MFSGEIYYYPPLNSSEKVDKIFGKTSVFLHNLLRNQRISRNVK